MTLAIGSDHAAQELKAELILHLKEQGIATKDFGPFDGERPEYPFGAWKVGTAVASGAFPLGVLLCGTGVGISIAANKIKGIRAVCCSEPFSARMSRTHNDSNILCMGARVVGSELAKMILDTWLSVEFEGDRHKERVDLIRAIEDGTLSLT